MTSMTKEEFLADMATHVELKRKKARETTRRWQANNKERDRQRHNTRRREKRIALVQHAGGKCVDCDTTYPPQVFDFHHRDPVTKSFTLNTTNMELNWSKLVEELDKCDLLCANCHRIRHILTST